MNGNVRPVPGTVPRNGMPPSKDYVYRGLGYDQLSPGPSIAGLRRRGVTPEGFKPYVYGAATGRPSPARPDLVLAAAEAGITEADRRPGPEQAARCQLAICPACDVDRCDTCFGGTCRCACVDDLPALTAAPGPAPEPERCDACGYLLTAPGHLASCGTPDAKRIARLAGSVGARR